MRVGEAWAVLFSIAVGSIGTARAEVPAAAPTPSAASAKPSLPPAAPIAAVSEPAPPPPLPPELASTPLRWERHLEVGADLLIVLRSTNAAVTLAPAVGYGAHVNWQLLRYLGFTFYLEGAEHAVSITPRALGQPGTLTSGGVSTYMFGGRLSPTVAVTHRLRLWATLGLGWGRFAYPRMAAKDPDQSAFSIPERSAFVTELPMGGGVAFDLIPRWLSIQTELTGAFILHQTGSAQEPAQAIDALGKKRTIGALPEINSSIIQSIGLSLVL